MKHCPNPGCPHAESTGRLPEYDDSVVICANCKTRLNDGPAPVTSPVEIEPPATIARFSNAHEAHVARAALASHGIDAAVEQDHSPYVSAGSWVQLQVAQSDIALARSVLEEGPVLTADRGMEAGDVNPSIETEGPVDDDMRPMRLSRRILLARWFLYFQALGGFLAVPAMFGAPLVGLVIIASAICALVLALWSRREPRSAFAAGLVFETLLTMGAVAKSGPMGLTALIPLVAVYFAWVAAGEHPPDRLQAKPRATRSAEVEIGEKWRKQEAERQLTDQ